ncbi:hypothetical protein LTR04_002976 [Oleoguttula sp. CCFEE 6159]|nr:hypothetical protein LTR04_002976 [Oleoguttula sp. CCFEE 6159]
MNWTGGRLQRHSRGGGNTLINRQKAHFARVRTTLQNGTSDQLSLVPSFLNEADNGAAASTTLFSDSLRRPARHHSERQRASPGSLQSLFSSKRGRRRAIGASSHINKRASTRRRLPEAEHRGVLEMEATSMERVNKSRDGPSTGPPSEEQLLAANRRRLLQGTDWLGLAPSRPLHMHFASRKEKDRIGKRRKIDNRSHPYRAAIDGRMRVPSLEHELDMRGPFMSGALPVEQTIKIRIGDDALASQSQFSTRRNETNHQHHGPIRRESSGSMLLDAEQEEAYVQQEDYPTEKPIMEKAPCSTRCTKAPSDEVDGMLRDLWRSSSLHNYRDAQASSPQEEADFLSPRHFQPIMQDTTCVHDVNEEEFPPDLFEDSRRISTPIRAAKEGRPTTARTSERRCASEASRYFPTVSTPVGAGTQAAFVSASSECTPHNETSQFFLHTSTPIGAGTQAEFVLTRGEKHRGRNETSQPLSMTTRPVGAGTHARFPPKHAERDQKHKDASPCPSTVSTPVGAGTQAGAASASRAEHETRTAPSPSPWTACTPVGAGTQAPFVTTSSSSAPGPTTPASRSLATLSTPAAAGTHATFFTPRRSAPSAFTPHNEHSPSASLQQIAALAAKKPAAPTAEVDAAEEVWKRFVFGDGGGGGGGGDAETSWETGSRPGSGSSSSGDAEEVDLLVS